MSKTKQQNGKENSAIKDTATIWKKKPIKVSMAWYDVLIRAATQGSLAILHMNNKGQTQELEVRSLNTHKASKPKAHNVIT